MANYLLNLFNQLTFEQRESKKLNSVLYRYFEEKIPTTISQINRRFSKIFSEKRLYAYGWPICFD